MEEFNKLMEKYIYLLNTDRKLRSGQAFMLALFEINKPLYDDITSTNTDCFYNNGNLGKCIEYVQNFMVGE